MRKGVTLIELLIAMAIVAAVTLSSTRAFVSALNFEKRLRSSRDSMTARDQFEDKLTFLIHHAWLSSSTTDQNSYFIGGAPSVITTTGGTGATGATGGTAAASSPASSGGASVGGGTGAYGTPNVIVFTAAGLPIPSAVLASNDDFETNNQNFGPVGGIQEIEISQTPVGSGGQGKNGLFIRTQTPADSDPTQGGTEQLLSPDVTQLGFEFFDGQNWDQSWDSRQQTPLPGRLPAAIRVTYRFQNDSIDHVLVVMLPASNASYLNPVTVTG